MTAADVLTRLVRPQPTRRLRRAAAARARVELRAVTRNRTSLVFTLLFPVLLLVVFGSIFRGRVAGTSTDFKQVFMAGIIAAGIMSVAFQGLAISVATDRDSGLLRRLGRTPMPRSAYFIGKIVRVGLTALVEVAVLLAVSAALFGLPLPGSPARWLTLVWVTLLGTAACALLAIAYSAVIPNARTATAIVTPPFMVLQFISGVFFPFNELPRWMQTVAALFPLKWMAQGLRSVFLPDSFTAVEPARSWEHGHIALVLALWCAAGLAGAVLSFRWSER
ncbi:MAG TPA: ABC transporter permease [Jatrophihabitantaceae bacterium]